MKEKEHGYRSVVYVPRRSQILPPLSLSSSPISPLKVTVFDKIVSGSLVALFEDHPHEKVPIRGGGLRGVSIIEF
jgi:hypothetical protein